MNYADILVAILLADFRERCHTSFFLLFDMYQWKLPMFMELSLEDPLRAELHPRFIFCMCY